MPLLPTLDCLLFVFLGISLLSICFDRSCFPFLLELVWSISQDSQVLYLQLLNGNVMFLSLRLRNFIFYEADRMSYFIVILSIEDSIGGIGALYLAPNRFEVDLSYHWLPLILYRFVCDLSNMYPLRLRLVPPTASVVHVRAWLEP